MKALSYTKYKKGVITLEILLAFTILFSCITCVLLLTFGNQTLKRDAEINSEALHIAKNNLEETINLSKQNFSSVVPIASTMPGTITYTKNIFVRDITQCKKQATSTVSWNLDTKEQKIEIGTFLYDTQETRKLGGDCALQTANSTWNSPLRFASDTLAPAKPTALDVLNAIAYVGKDTAPFLAISDLKTVSSGQSSLLFTTFENSFDLGVAPNDIDVVNWVNSSGVAKQYAFLAMNSATEQLVVVDVTDIKNPAVVNKTSLSSCVTGSSPQGFRIFYYGNRLYLTTRYTAGPEFHIFNISNPTSPIEIGSGSCKGRELGNTVNDFVVKDTVIAGNARRYLYMATDEVDKELRVFDVTGDVVSEVTVANRDLPGAQNGQSLFLLGNKLYFGRQSVPTGDDMYIFNVENPTSAIPTLGSVDVGTGVTGIRVVGKYAFISTPKVNKEFQVWDIGNPASIVNISTYSFKGIVPRGIDYEYDSVYTISSILPNFQIIYDP